jgi:DNA-directed RNA polymerase specialized sigma24 family protein
MYAGKNAVGLHALYQREELRRKMCYRKALLKFLPTSCTLSETEGSFEGWMRRIFVNTALSALRTKQLKFADSLDNHLESFEG